MHPYRWKYDAQSAIWTKGNLRVSAGLLAVIDTKTVVRHKKLASLRALAISVSRVRRSVPPPIATRRMKRRILARINEGR